MSRTRGERNFVSLPGFAALLYDRLMKSKPTMLQYQEIAQELVSRLNRGRLLDIGTGPGLLLKEIYSINPKLDLFGLDISKEMIKRAERNLNGIDVKLWTGSIQSSGYEDDFFDLVTCSGSFYLWDHPITCLDEIHRLLKSGKRACLFETHRDVDFDLVNKRLRINLKGENLIRRILTPWFFHQQLKMTFDLDEIIHIIQQSKFRNSYQIGEVILADMPVWLRIELRK